MNTELLERIMTAEEYQKKAVYALFPEELRGHLEVIEKEVQMMSAELVRSWVLNEQKYAQRGKSKGKRHADRGQNCDREDSDSCNYDGPDSGRQNHARKIDIM